MSEETNIPILNYFLNVVKSSLVWLLPLCYTRCIFNYLQFKNMHPDEPWYFLGYHHLRKLGKLFPSETFVQVIPGSSDKLMIFFQGGGACFNDVSTQQAALCLTKLSW